MAFSASTEKPTRAGAFVRGACCPFAEQSLSDRACLPDSGRVILVPTYVAYFARRRWFLSAG
jgi:hypothetical protein